MDDIAAVNAAKIQATSKLSLAQLFVVSETTQESPWIRSIMRVVDRTVVAGLTFDKLTKDIAKDIVQQN